MFNLRWSTPKPLSYFIEEGASQALLYTTVEKGVRVSNCLHPPLPSAIEDSSWSLLYTKVQEGLIMRFQFYTTPPSTVKNRMQVEPSPKLTWRQTLCPTHSTVKEHLWWKTKCKRFSYYSKPVQDNWVLTWHRRARLSKHWDLHSWVSKEYQSNIPCTRCGLTCLMSIQGSIVSSPMW